jgi:hypothetical protein
LQRFLTVFALQNFMTCYRHNAGKKLPRVGVVFGNEDHKAVPNASTLGDILTSCNFSSSTVPTIHGF